MQTPWNRDLVFAWTGRDAAGGWDDCAGSLSDLDGAVAIARAKGDRWQVVDVVTGAVVRRWDHVPA